MSNKFTIDSTNIRSPFLIRDYLYDELTPVLKQKRPIVFICIGTDRSTGDSLGPLVGEKLKYMIQNEVYIYGNLKEPVHAKNLNSILDEINCKFNNPFIIAIDACLGDLDNVGKIYIDKKPLLPGIAVNKNLPPVGDISILGVVNISGSLEFMVLQNTRLYTVMTIADAISRGIHHCILKSIGFKKNPIEAKIESILSK
ncbi:spore protease YyaC [Clostridium folliculivorans]|uniref:Spore protease YyaC n=1 Tax=Clostridium folliculivorans TaxID=2886038 RepID=A0A9W6DB17_9CLOT|nr:spore protease YyaC [Clostridium folliculivorans]GKU25829.1 spore protease YyaC [Clostridium folliculivorans]GKU27915.1 spore protease YyaC [Clostridium folliculivorans]